MSTTKTFNNIKSGKRHQIDATARGYYDFRTTVVPQPNKPLLYNMKVYDGLKYDVDLSKNSVRPGEINFDGTVLPYVENNTLTKTNYCFGNSGTNYDLPIYEEVYSNITKVGDVSINNGIAAFAVLDAQYRNPSVEWVESNIVNSLTDMPLYTIDEALAAKESATHNTDYVISVGGEGAFSYCRSIDPLNYNGKTYNCQLPNAYELNEIYNNRESLDTFDTTVSANETKKLSNWGFGNPYQEVLSSSRDKQFGYGFHLNYRDGNQVFWRGNPGRLGVCPIIEIPLSK